MPEFELTASPSPEELAAITDALSAFNTGDVGPSDRRPLAVLIRDTDGKVTGGLSGFTAWGWLFTQMLYIPDTLRGTGLAGEILAKAEDEARTRGCRGAWIDTFSPLALRAYLRQGYEVFGELQDFPEGRTRSFLRKNL
ncbi:MULTISPECIES: GNAT family N-acetyltransferase [Rhizobium]|jgi:GNAT superfamily N-acetyltransferase|uniref:GNAT family N-acetyltransferase n=1 Tax=Rhizobium anhuiense TaxID=1184720 RepID=A0A3S0QBK4_9HYPH|nr:MULTISPECIES: GNAT family N-acetyltransferase [Rhizobium]MBB3296673.1 GNAT superfamily N-acetyltransferase [Rhizobium sp. BK112]MBB3365888.1 GNAT superfamily N-acetyltransferase [Rhizobium sp. BK077]MBB3740866.1 GNAT superfamily N-acetyltransferase [Rhizobium sp. BK591]MBB4111429.1 GNAT superfamily N-acetyltransferase [Rhizobium sp. BK226]MBB4176566.1 GNAT superfamily N-acetyltransferase [Rhizobium sp. BK109]